MNLLSFIFLDAIFPAKTKLIFLMPKATLLKEKVRQVSTEVCKLRF